MIPPREQWCHQIVVTNACNRQCANCTQLLSHQASKYFMSPEQFSTCCKAEQDFVDHQWITQPRHTPPPIRYGSSRTRQKPKETVSPRRRRIVGIFGGEPLLHPQFPALVDAMCAVLHDPRQRGLWTGLEWKTGQHPVWGRHQPQVERLLGTAAPANDAQLTARAGFLNWNRHQGVVVHQPVLVASGEVVQSEQERWRLIEACWLQKEWSSAYTIISGELRFFFCEVAAALARTFGWNGGLPVSDTCWRHDLHFETVNGIRQPVGRYAEQIRWACPRCSICLPLPSRPDNHDIDDISPGNVIALRESNSPRIRAGDYLTTDIGNYYAEKFYQSWRPFEYRLDGKPGQG